MNKSQQLNLTLATQKQIWQSWAFANKRRIITACSRQAKMLGINVGMDYDEAITKLPGIRILILDNQKGKRARHPRTFRYPGHYQSSML